MDKEFARKAAELDRAAEKAGGYVVYPSNTTLRCDHRRVIAYCKERGIKPTELTPAEFNCFVFE